MGSIKESPYSRFKQKAYSTVYSIIPAIGTEFDLNKTYTESRVNSTRNGNMISKTTAQCGKPRPSTTFDMTANKRSSSTKVNAGEGVVARENKVYASGTDGVKRNEEGRVMTKSRRKYISELTRLLEQERIKRIEAEKKLSKATKFGVKGNYFN